MRGEGVRGGRLRVGMRWLSPAGGRLLDVLNERLALGGLSEPVVLRIFTGHLSAGGSPSPPHQAYHTPRPQGGGRGAVGHLGSHLSVGGLEHV